MIGSGNRRRTVVQSAGVVACVLFLLAGFGSQGNAGLNRVLRERLGVRSLGFGQGSGPPARVIRAESARLRAAEQRALAVEPGLVRVAGLAFDPLRDGPVPQVTGLPPAVYGGVSASIEPPSFSSEHVYWLVQYERAGPVHEALEKRDVEVLRSVPNRCYIVRAREFQRAEVEGIEGVTWVGDFLPMYKVDTQTRAIIANEHLDLDVDSRGLLRFEVSFHEGIDAEPYRSLIEQLPGTELELLIQRGDDPSRMQVLVEPVALSEFVSVAARLHDVRAVDLLPVMRPHLDHSHWFLQTGLTDLSASNYDTTARLFALGLDGEGLIAAVQDDGLENDNCSFKYSNDVDDACWPLAPDPFGGATPEEQGALGTLRTRLRKTVAYVLFSGADAYSSSVQHGTRVSSCVVGDRFGPNSAIAARPLVRDLGILQNLQSCERPGGQWAVGDSLRSDIADMVDDPTVNELTFPIDYGQLVQHHQAQDGTAPGALLLFQDIGNGAGELVGGNTALSSYEQAVDYGATVHNASFGGPACVDCYTGAALGADIALWRNRMLLGVSSAGNDGELGPRTISGGISQGKNVLTVGATERANTTSAAPRPGEDRANYSSIGPSSGGMLKPELCAPGSIRVNGGTQPAEDGSGSGDNDCDEPAAVTGTSFSSPSVAGIGLLVQQYFLDGWYPEGIPNPANALRPTNALTRAVLINSCRNLRGLRTDDTGIGSAPRPSFGQGWGAPRLDDTLYFAGDPLRNDPHPEGDTERERFLVLNDTPNGMATVVASELVPEPGGRSRTEIVPSLQAALRDGGYHSYALNVVNPDPSDVANELRVTMCYTDAPGGAIDAPLAHDVDLELISPSGVIYRPDPITAWEDGFTRPSTDQTPQSTTAPFADLADRDALNTCENVFVESVEVEEGNWQLNVIGYSIPGGGAPDVGLPNFVINDLPPTIDTSLPCDATPDIDAGDSISPADQGYALIVSGNFTTTQGLVSLNRSTFGCSNDELFVTVGDQNGDAPPDGPACPPRAEIVVELVTTTPGPSFPEDRELITLTGTQPIYTHAVGLPVTVVADGSEVIHGDGIVQLAEGELFTVVYEDISPCGGTSFAQASVSCRPSVSDQGVAIAGGCDVVNPAIPATSTVRADQFLDADETVRYTVFFANDGSRDLENAVVTLTPDPADPLIQALGTGAVEVLDSPQIVGLAPPGRRSDATFTVVMGPRCVTDCGPLLFDGIPCQYQLEFQACVSAPSNDLPYPDCFVQSRVLEADTQSFDYSTRDPNGELYGFGGIRRLVPGAAEDSTNPDDYVRFQPMWFDPDADCGAGPGSCASICDVSRADGPPPPICLSAGIRVDNPLDPWDFDEDDEGFYAASYTDDPNQVGPACSAAQEWFWKASPDGGGCGWEDEISSELTRPDSDFDTSHPDVFDQPWGIWHTGEMNAVVGNDGPFPGAVPPSEGVPYLDDEDSPLDHTIYWDPPGPGDNSAGQWCQSYISDPVRFPNFYRSFLKPPTLHRVHQSNPAFRVEFRDLEMYSRLDGHTLDSRNLSVASWAVSNQPVAPVMTAGCPSFAWSRFQYLQLIFTDDVLPEWSVDDNTLGENLNSTNATFPDLSYEDIYGSASTSWDFTLSWGHLNLDGFTSNDQYGWGIDDVHFEWSELRDVCDEGDCSEINGGVGQEPQVFFTANRYNACEGQLDIVVLDDTTPMLPTRIAVCVSSDAEDAEAAYLDQVANGRWEGSIPFSADPAVDVLGTLLVAPGQADTGAGADDIRVEYDPGNAADHDPDSSVSEICDWVDVAPADGINDDVDGDGEPDAEDGSDLLFERERVDFSVINCTSGRLFYIRHHLEDAAGGGGDGDLHADHGETVWMSVTLTSQLASDLRDVEVTISTEDDTVCIIQDTVFLDVLPGGNILTETPIDPGGPLGEQGFLFSVPSAVRTTDLADPATVTFRIDVQGVNQGNLNEFSTLGSGFNSFQPMEAMLVLDVDSRSTTADYSLGPVIGEFNEGFEGSSGGMGFDNPRIPNAVAGVAPPRFLDATTDTRYGADTNEGFCPECPVATDCMVPDECDHRFTPAEAPLTEPEWAYTTDWAYTGNQALKFGDPDAGVSNVGQHYRRGQFVAFELPPLRLASDPAITPELDFRQIAAGWFANFTSGLSTPIGGLIVEISASPTGVDALSPNVYRSTEHARPATIEASFPMSSFRPLYAYQAPYDTTTDALNACRTLFCGQHHHVYSNMGDAFNSPGSASDPRSGSDGHSTWEHAVVDLSDYRGQEVLIRFVIQVMQDLEVQNGALGWLHDDIRVAGVSTALGLEMQAVDNGLETCSLQAAFASSSDDCFGDEVTLFDRHDGLGLFRGDGTPEPISYEWELSGDAGTFNLPPTLGGVPLTLPGTRGTSDDPIVDPVALGVLSMPGLMTVTQTLHQAGMPVSSFVDTVVVKDLPVPSLSIVGSGPFAGGETLFRGEASIEPTPDPLRDLVYFWDFGDGTPVEASGALVTHVFATTGAHDVELCIRDEDGCEGCSILTVMVDDRPDFVHRDAVVVGECAAPGSPGLGDGNGDIHEQVTIAVTFDNAGAAATDVVGYLSSTDPNVTILGGVARFGDVGPGATSPAAEYTFLYSLDGMPPGCLVVPFELSLVSDGGAVVQDVGFAFPMGGSADAMGGGALTGPATSLCLGDPAPTILSTAGPAGCLDGLTFSLDVEGVGLASIGQLTAVRLRPPGRSPSTIYLGDGVDPSLNLDLCFEFDADVGLTDTCGTLDPALADLLVEELIGVQMGGTWQLEVSTITAGTCLAGQWLLDNAQLDLRGANPLNLDIGVEAACEDCLSPTTPVFDGVDQACVVGGRGHVVSWSPARDGAACPGSDDLEYELYASTTEGQLGDPVVLLGDGDTCADCPAMSQCAFERAPGASVWEVCSLTDVYWTVVVSDEGDASTRVPDVSMPADAVPDAYQTESVACAAAPVAPIIAVLRDGDALEIWVDVPTGGRPPIPARPGGPSYHLFQGRLLDLHGGYTHESVLCEFSGPMVTHVPPPGSHYYLVPGANGDACLGMGYRGTRAGTGGPLEHVEGRPSGISACGGDCLP
ncbi:MAG: S8 family serine peptidase [Acidobacteriota bacterium]